ncbi:MAG: hypothetical protein CMM47_10450 [Rhodospirillaceae bacterium]|nr:hypothetical protein [Rhodospirillaceae bacterium]
MVTARVRTVYRQKPEPVLVVGLDGRPLWSQLWDNNPKITRNPDLASQKIVDGPGARPYLDYARMTKSRFAFHTMALEPGEIFLSDDEKAMGRTFVLVEPTLKRGASLNKDWGFARYQAVVDALPHLPWTQFDYGAPILRGVDAVSTQSFRHACALMSSATAALLPEGGLHHAAAALGIPAVVIFGAYISPDVTGYDGHINIAREVPDVAGLKLAHPVAQEALSSISIGEIATAIASLVQRDLQNNPEPQLR